MKTELNGKELDTIEKKIRIFESDCEELRYSIDCMEKNIHSLEKLIKKYKYTEDELMDFAMYVVLEKPLKAYNDMSREAFEKVLEKWKAKRD